MQDRETIDLYKNIDDQIEKIEKLDIYTSEHVHNVQRVTANICKKIGMKNEEIKFYANCALLHDIGKIFVPSSILQKPSKLTKEEYEIMKKHTSKGYEFCMSQNSLKKYANAVLYHHENEDGTGYPERS